MLTPKQKKQVRYLISQNPSVEYQEQLENEEFALKEIAQLSEKISDRLKQKLDGFKLIEDRIALHKWELADSMNKLLQQEADVKTQQNKLQKEIDDLKSK